MSGFRDLVDCIDIDIVDRNPARVDVKVRVDVGIVKRKERLRCMLHSTVEHSSTRIKASITYKHHSIQTSSSSCPPSCPFPSSIEPRHHDYIDKSITPSDPSLVY